MIDRETGEKRVGWLRNLKLNELSLVTSPANKDSRVAIFKSADARASAAVDITKYRWDWRENDWIERDEPLDVGRLAKAMYAMVEGEQPGPKTFAQLREQHEAWRREREVSEAMWPMFDALTESVRSIAASDLDLDAKLEMIRQSVQDFMNALVDEVPDVDEEIDKVLRTHKAAAAALDDEPEPQEGDDMDATKLQAEVDRLKGELATAEKALADEKAASAALKADNDSLKKAAEIAKTDETFETEGTVVRKSEVGEASFKVMKAQAERIERQEFEKQAASADYLALPGTAVEKGAALCAVSKIKDEPTRKALDAMLKGGAAALAKTMAPAGHDGGTGPLLGADVNKAEAEAALDKITKSIQEKDPTLSYAAAQAKALETDDGRTAYAAMTNTGRTRIVQAAAA